MPYKKVKDINLYYEDLGNGETILFLHSHFSRGILAFAAQIVPFQSKYRCLFPDFRGHGRTQCDNLTWNSRQIADDMINFLDELNIHKVYVLGYSCGTSVGMYMAAKYPERVQALIAIGAGVEPVLDGIEEYTPENIIARNDVELIETMKTRHFDAHKGNWQKYMEQTIIDWRLNPSLSEEEWNAIQCPTFFINGENDPFGTCDQLKKKCPHAQVFEVKGSGHRPHFVMEQGKEVNLHILNFLDTLNK